MWGRLERGASLDFDFFFADFNATDFKLADSTWIDLRFELNLPHDEYNEKPHPSKPLEWGFCPGGRSIPCLL
jgi:hypothetical protein